MKIWSPNYRSCAASDIPPLKGMLRVLFIIIIIIIIQKSLYTVAYSVTYQYINYLQNWFSKGRVLKAKILIN